MGCSCKVQVPPLLLEMLQHHNAAIGEEGYLI